MGRASADSFVSGHGAPARRRRRGFRLRRHRSPTPTSADDATSQELTPLSSAASASQQPSLHLPYQEDKAIGSIFITVSLPVFRGDPGECPDAHLCRFDRVCRANGDATAATAARIFPASLDADAALWYELTTAGVEDLSPPAWDAVRAAFLDFFRPPDAADRARDEIRALRQGSGETVNRCHLRLQGILRRIPDGDGVDVSDAFLKDAFVEGLRPEFKEWVAPQQPAALEEAVALALTWERAEGLREARRVAKEACGSSAAAAGKCAFCGIGEGHEEARCEVWRRMGELWRSSSINSVGGGGGAAATAANDGEGEGGGSKAMLERIGSAVSTRSTQCRCRKHQCLKKAVVAASEVGGGGGEGDVAAVAGQVTEATSVNLIDF